MGLRDTIIRIEGKAADIDLRLDRSAVFTAERLIFLKRSGETGLRWTVLLEPTGQYSMRWSNFRGQMVVSYFTGDPTFTNLVAQVSHVAYGAPVSNKIDLYNINPDRRDVVPPHTDSPGWKIYLTREPTERYTLP